MSDLALLRAFGLEELVQSNGHHKVLTVTCFNCGEEFEAKRHVPGTRAVCGKPECKRAAGAQRARDFRANRSKIQP